MSKIIELAVYKLKTNEEQNFEAHRLEMREGLEKYSGFISGLTFRDTANPGTYLDYYLWESLEEAEKAANEIQSNEKACSFLNAIDKLIHYGHYVPENNELIHENSFPNNEILEFAIGKIKESEIENFSQSKLELIPIVKGQEGLIRFTSANSHNDKAIFFDALCWENPDSAKKAMDAVHSNQACQEFMNTFEENIYFGHLKLAYK